MSTFTSILLTFFASVLISIFITYIVLKPKIKRTIERNNTIEKENQQLVYENENLKNVKENREKLLQIVDEEYSEAIIKKNQLKEENDSLLQKQVELRQINNVLNSNQEQLRLQNTSLESQNNELLRSFDSLKETQTQTAKEYYKQALIIAQNAFDTEVENISNKLNTYRQEAQEEYIQTLEDSVQQYEEYIYKKQTELNALNKTFEEQKKNVNIAVETAQRKLELETKQDYYRICLSAEDIAEIKRLREVLPYLRDKTPLNKVIYKVYYEKPLTDMIGRVVGTGIHTGIYKITNIENQMCYVGQAVDIASRWKQHCKRGVGAEDWTQNKLYPAMYSIGVENFTFEIIEECEHSKLNERERFWQNYFHAKSFGYSIK